MSNRMAPHTEHPWPAMPHRCSVSAAMLPASHPGSATVRVLRSLFGDSVTQLPPLRFFTRSTDTLAFTG